MLKISEPLGLKPDDIKNTPMGTQGEDVMLSPAARVVFPFQIECKSEKRMAVYAKYKQAQTHGPHEPIVVIKQNQDKPLVVVDAEWFFREFLR